MEVNKFASAVINIAVRVIILVFIITAVVKLSFWAYDFGFQIFVDAPVTVGSGRDVDVTIPMGKSAMDIGKILESNGLIEDSKVFYFQELLSAYHNKLKPGFYTLNTSMSVDEMMEIMSADAEEAEDTTGNADVNTDVFDNVNSVSIDEADMSESEFTDEDAALTGDEAATEEGTSGAGENNE